MTKKRISHILFSLAVIATLSLAMVPAPAYALSDTGASPVTVSAQASQSAPDSVIRVCRRVAVRHGNHIVYVRRCIRVVKR
jgi:hypothetical protein